MSGASPDTQAILLLTAPLIVGRGSVSSDGLLGRSEYQGLARHLHGLGYRPADLLGANRDEVVRSCALVADEARLRRLLGRGVQLSQAMDRWQARAIWVISRADGGYPRRLKAHLREDAPPLLYGCGDGAVLDTGGLAVVGSRHASAAMLEYAADAAQSAAQAGCTVISGGARGVDQAAMAGALRAGGSVTGVLAHGLDKAVLERDHRFPLQEGRMALVSPYDPAAGFNVGHAMQRNKLVYALSQASLVVEADYDKGGTWAGATEQLDRLHFVPVYVRPPAAGDRGLDALLARGALPWPDAHGVGALLAKLGEPVAPAPQVPVPVPATMDPAEALFTLVRDTTRRLLTSAMKEAEVAAALDVSAPQARLWLQRLVAEGTVDRAKSRYIARATSLFDA